MIRYAAGRLAHGLAVVFGVVTLVFILIRLAPGDPVSVLSAERSASAEVRSMERRRLGLDRPIPVQYARFVGELARGDLGTSITRRRPVRDMLAERIPNTLLLAAAALLVDLALGVAIAVAQAMRPGGRLDRVLAALTLSLYSIPVFWLGALALILFGQTLHWLPIGGMRSDVIWSSLSPVQRIVDVLSYMVLPAFTLGLVGAATTARYQRAALVSALRQDFIRTARATGIGERAILLRHALRNAMLPIITLVGLSLPALFSGAVFVETVFSWPGMGRLATQAFYDRDYPVITATALFASVLVVTGSALADVLYRVADPRTRPAA